MTIRVEPIGRSFETRPGETVLAAGQRAGLKWPTSCGGNGQCGWCHVVVRESAAPLAEPNAIEAFTLRHTVPRREGQVVRLACQLRPTGDLVLERSAIQ